MYEDMVKSILARHSNTKKIFLGVFARDEIPDNPTFPSCFIVNTDPRDQPGEHWLALYFNESGFCEFFDSLARSPSYYNLANYLNKSSTGWTWNRRRLQSDASDFCGFYAVLFLLYRSENRLSHFFNEFYFKHYNNDQKIFRTIKEILN